jgi:membrane-bound lytic murein transglycosylase B
MKNKLPQKLVRNEEPRLFFHAKSNFPEMRMKTQRLTAPIFFLLNFNVCSLLFLAFFIPATARDESAEGIASVQLSDTSTWRIGLENIFNANAEPANPFIADLLERLAARTGPGKPVTRDEFVQLLLQMEDNQIYTSQLIKYATPVSKKIQDEAHVNYAAKLMKPEKFQAGVEFLRQHQALFQSAQKKFTVPPKDILGILMWESALGKYTGKYRIFNVFLGLILYLEQAEQLALEQLKLAGDSVALAPPNQDARFNRLRSNAVKNAAVLLRMTKNTEADPLAQLGSWGGAIGYVQFMPASLRFAVDADSNGVINLTDWPDAIHSVANYLQQAGYGNSPASRKRAIFAYNRLDSYVNGVMNYADSTWNRFEKEMSLPDSAATPVDSTTAKP